MGAMGASLDCFYTLPDGSCDGDEEIEVEMLDALEGLL